MSQGNLNDSEITERAYRLLGKIDYIEDLTERILNDDRICNSVKKILAANMKTDAYLVLREVKSLGFIQDKLKG